MPVEDFLALPRLFSSFSSNSRKREKTRGKRENPFRIKKRLPNLSSAVTLPLLSYLAQSPTGRCQSGRMSTPGKCVYRKPVPRVRIPPCPPSIFCRNIFVMSILRFLFVGGMGKKWGKYWKVGLIILTPVPAFSIILTITYVWNLKCLQDGWIVGQWTFWYFQMVPTRPNEWK